MKQTRSLEALFALAIFLAAMAALFLVGCGRAAKSPEEARPEVRGAVVTFPKGSAGIKRLATEKVESPFDRDIVLPGRLVWDEDRTVRVFPPFAGRVSRILVNAGDRVAAGQPLALIASAEFGQAQADSRRAQADLAVAETSLARAMDLHAHGVLSTKDLEQAKADEAKARAEADRASGRLSAYGHELETANAFRLASPMAGVVVERNLNPGQELRTDQGSSPIFVVTDPTHLWISLDANEADLQFLRPGLPIGFSSNQFPDDSFSAELVQLPEFVDPVSRTLKVRGRVPNNDRRLKAEMFVTARIRIPKNELPTVTSRAVYLSGAQNYAFVRSGDGQYTRKAVRVGPEVDGRMPVVSGLKPGDEVVTTGSLFLEQMIASARDDAPAEVKSAKTP